jgi:hypothetical protein
LLRSRLYNSTSVCLDTGLQSWLQNYYISQLCESNLILHSKALQYLHCLSRSCGYIHCTISTSLLWFNGYTTLIQKLYTHFISIVPMCCGSQRHPPPRGDFWTRELLIIFSSWLSGASSSILFAVYQVILLKFSFVPVELFSSH